VSGFNKPKRTPNHPTKSHVVVAKSGDQVKTIRFGQQGEVVMAKKEVWDKPNPKKKSTPLSPAAKASAKAAAKKAGRKYPNLVDNMRAARKKAN
jgi:hypothetical protein